MNDNNKFFIISQITTGLMIFILVIMCCMALFTFGQNIVLLETEANAIDWSIEYPFENENEETSKPVSFGIISKIRKVQEIINDSVSKSLVFENEFAYMGNWLEAKIGWDADCVTDYNPTYRLEGNYIANMKCECDEKLVWNEIESITKLKEFCEDKGIVFSYVCLPNKLDKKSDTDFNGLYQYGNRNADNLLAGLESNYVDILDMRENIYGGGYKYHDLFFDTDHHWKPQTGLLAAGWLAEYLNENYSSDLSLEFFETDLYEEVIFEDSYLGSYGQKLTKAKVEADDISFYYPKFDTNFTLEIPELNINKTGDFSVIYNQKYIDAPMYGAYMYGGFVNLKLYNNLAENSLKILVLKDSFSSVMLPFLALTVSEIDLLDLREFNGSIQTYIEKEKPDIVLVSYYVDNVGYDKLFDFR